MTSTDELLARFRTPAGRYGPIPLWWWSGDRLESGRLCTQMDDLARGGISEAVVISLAPAGPSFGSRADDPPFLSAPWLEILQEVCEHARRTGFALWLYDQIGFSGANFQGQLVAAEPRWVGRRLEATEHRHDDHRPVGAFRRAGGVDTLVYADPFGFDYFEPAACAALIDRVHGTIERSVGEHFGSTIRGFFQDELAPMPSWGSTFGDSFEDAHGYRIDDHIGALFEAGTPADGQVRYHYQLHRTRLASAAFFEPLTTWLADRDLQSGFDQRSPAREGDPAGSVALYGDYLVTHAGYSAPGSDHWGDTKIHSSLAHVNGHERTWLEAFHSTGWGGTLEETLDWLTPFLQRGATLYNPHAVYYSTAGGWWEWAPPSTCWRQPYWPQYRLLAAAVRRSCSVLTAGSHVCDVAVLYPTAAMQTSMGVDGPVVPVDRARESYMALNGTGPWPAEHRGVLGAAGIDHDVVHESAIASADLDANAATLRIGDECFHTVVVPEVDVLDIAAAGTLARFAASGGRVICVGHAPTSLVGDATHSPTDATSERWHDAVDAGQVLITELDDVAAAVARGQLLVETSVPHLVRRIGDVVVVALFAHDEITGTALPTVGEEDGYLFDGGNANSLLQLNEALHQRGYEFRPLDNRRVAVSVAGAPSASVQQWSPGRGDRRRLDTAPGGELRFDVGFEDGPIQFVVIGDDLPAAPGQPAERTVARIPLDRTWAIQPFSTLDNDYGDFGSPARPGLLPIEIWRFDHFEGATRPPDDLPGRPTTATFGPFASAREIGDDGPGAWRELEWSLSRGIRHDPVFDFSLGPKGQVPDEFLALGRVFPGNSVEVVTHLVIPDAEDVVLVVGASAARTVRLAGRALDTVGAGYQTQSTVPADLRGREVELAIVFTSSHEVDLRASFAFVTDQARFLRPEWLTAAGTGSGGDTWTVATAVERPDVPSDPRLVVWSDGPCELRVNGTVIGAHGSFNPYAELRFATSAIYDIGAALRPGTNEIEVAATDVRGLPTSIAVDSILAGDGGVGVSSAFDWTATRSGRAVATRLSTPDEFFERRSLQLQPRPHSLPHSDWIDPTIDSTPTVVHVVPGIGPSAPRTEWLRAPVPPGTTRVLVTADELTMAWIAGDELRRSDDGWFDLHRPSESGMLLLLRFDVSNGPRQGALLDGPVVVDVEEATSPLVSWEELGLRNLGGLVRYRSSIELEPNRFDESRRFVLDLGELRGTAELIVNDVVVGDLAWAPWRFDVTSHLEPGENHIEVVIRGTLAGYFADTSPTRFAFPNQIRAGLFGPVTVDVLESIDLPA